MTAGVKDKDQPLVLRILILQYCYCTAIRILPIL
jgi:hypothetical protein